MTNAWYLPNEYSQLTITRLEGLTLFSLFVCCPVMILLLWAVVSTITAKVGLRSLIRNGELAVGVTAFLIYPDYFAAQVDHWKTSSQQSQRS
jgi:hypothetical protein